VESIDCLFRRKGGIKLHNIRKCTTEDIKAVVHLSELWVNENITHGLAANTPSILQERIGSYFWVAEKEGDIIGYIYGTIHISEGLAVIPAGE
jgi:hypothetical protein